MTGRRTDGESQVCASIAASRVKKTTKSAVKIITFRCEVMPLFAKVAKNQFLARKKLISIVQFAEIIIKVSMPVFDK